MPRRFIPKNDLEELIFNNFNNSKKIKDFLDNLSKNSKSVYKCGTLKYFIFLKVKNPDNYLQNPRLMTRKNEIVYICKIEDDVKKWSNYWKESPPKTWYNRVNAVKQLLIANRIRLDDYFWKTLHNGTRVTTVSTKETPTKTQLRSILMNARAEEKSLFLIQATSGSRISEILSLDIDDIEYKNLDFIRFKVYFDNNKTKINVNKRASIEAKEALLEYLKKRDKIIEVRKKRAGNNKNSVDDKKLFPMSVKLAEDKWNNLVKSAKFYNKSKFGNRGTMTTHCLRRFFKKQFEKYDKDWSSYFRGKPTQDDRDYDVYTVEEIDKFYLKGVQHLLIDKIPINTDIEIENLKKQMLQLQKALDGTSFIEYEGILYQRLNEIWNAKVYGPVNGELDEVGNFKPGNKILQKMKNGEIRVISNGGEDIMIYPDD